MIKRVLVLMMVLLATSMMLVSAESLEVKQIDFDQVMISGMNQPAIFNLEMKNNGVAESFKFFNLIGFPIEPIEYVDIASGETKQVEVKVFPRASLNYRGYYSLDYTIKDSKDLQKYAGSFKFKMVDLEDAVDVGAQQIDPQSQTMVIYIRNRENFNFSEMKVRFSSPFFEREETLTLDPMEKKTFSIQLDKEQFKHLTAGFYTLTAKVEIGGQKAYVEGTINFLEKDIVTSIQKDEGFIINTKVMRKSNQGNVVASTQTVIQKNIVSRLFTTISPQPDVVERKGFDVFYTWNRELQPGENLDIEVKTNWLFPFIAALFILAIATLARIYTKTHVDVRKSVSFVKAKGGEFALKVTMTVKAKEYVEKISIIDKLPPLAKMYEKFGGEQPVRVNEKAGRVEWMFDKMHSNETKTLSYIIYSKVGILGKFVLPAATVVYERKGEIKEAHSNKAFFMSEQSSKQN
ncbi:hypothetical protein J4474_04430 [Candidatus Pacearchaeota archaeon]|nr:hypothetical protein [Candidatus Pacearchaeota archaeon]